MIRWILRTSTSNSLGYVDLINPKGRPMIGIQRIGKRNIAIDIYASANCSGEMELDEVQGEPLA